MTRAELMEVSDDTLAIWASMLSEEISRRNLGTEAGPIHAGNVIGNKPIPLLVRVIKKVATLPPTDLAKVETLMNGFHP